VITVNGTTHAPVVTQENPESPSKWDVRIMNQKSFIPAGTRFNMAKSNSLGGSRYLRGETDCILLFEG